MSGRRPRGGIHRLSEFRLGPGPIPAVSLQIRSLYQMCFRKRWVDLKCAIGALLRSLESDVARHYLPSRDHGVGGRKTRMCERIARIESDGALIEIDATLQGVRIATSREILTQHVALIRLRVARVPSVD